jgi:hypothetical protein
VLLLHEKKDAESVGNGVKEWDKGTAFERIGMRGLRTSAWMRS